MPERPEHAAVMGERPLGVWKFKDGYFFVYPCICGGAVRFSGGLVECREDELRGKVS